MSQWDSIASQFLVYYVQNCVLLICGQLSSLITSWSCFTLGIIQEASDHNQSSAKLALKWYFSYQVLEENQ